MNCPDARALLPGLLARDLAPAEAAAVEAHLGGCGDCRGVVTIYPATGAVTRNVEYYVLGHASRFVLPGAYRVGVTRRGGEVEAAAFLNPDGSRVAILHRKAGDGPISIAIDGRRYSVPLPDGSVATLRLSAPRK